MSSPARSYPFSAAHALDLDPTYEELRGDEPVTRVTLPYGGEAWLATRYEDVRTVLGDPRFSRAATVGQDVPRVRPEVDTSRESILNMDPPEHSRLRKLVARAFTARRVEELRPRAQEIMDGLVAEMVKQGPPVDLVEAVSTPLPVTVICELLGVPVGDRDIFRAGADAALSTTSMTPEERVTARDELGAYMAGLVAQRRQAPTDDLLGALVVARDEQDRLTEIELIQLSMGVLIAGHETTLNQIGNFTYLLLTHPDELAGLREHPDHIPAAVEELLRYVPLGAGAGFVRVATEDIQLGDVLVRKGESVMPAVQSANRDPNVFDGPEGLVWDRESNPHMGFGHGAHHCLGAPLARLEARIALDRLLARFPGLAPADPAAPPRWRPSTRTHGLLELPVTFGKDPGS